MDPGKIKQVMEERKKIIEREQELGIRGLLKEQLEMVFKEATDFPVDITSVFTFFCNRIYGGFPSEHGFVNFCKFIGSILKEYNKNSSTTARYEFKIEKIKDGICFVYLKE